MISSLLNRMYKVLASLSPTPLWSPDTRTECFLSSRLWPSVLSVNFVSHSLGHNTDKWIVFHTNLCLLEQRKIAASDLINSLHISLSSADLCTGLCPGACTLHSVAPVPGPDLGLQLTCDPEDGAGQSLEAGLEILPEEGRVAVIDSVTGSGQCDVSSLLAAITFWCQGKPGGCSLQPSTLSSLTSCSDLSLVRISWHQEQDYSSTEIPCPAYNRGPLSKKFSKSLQSSHRTQQFSQSIQLKISVESVHISWLAHIKLPHFVKPCSRMLHSPHEPNALYLSPAGEHVLPQDPVTQHLAGGPPPVLDLGRGPRLPPPLQQVHAQVLAPGHGGGLAGGQPGVPRQARPLQHQGVPARDLHGLLL